MKVAILGTAETHIAEAPYDDPSWIFVGVAPRLIEAPVVMERWNEWVEIHDIAHAQPGAFSDEYKFFLASATKPVWMISPLGKARQFPKDEIVKASGYELCGEWRSDVLTSSVAWAGWKALLDMEKVPATQEDPHMLGLWGIDMAIGEEWSGQRNGCLALFQECHRRGVKVVLPETSKLRVRTKLYGAEHADRTERGFRFMLSRMAGEKARAEAALQKAAAEVNSFSAAEHILKTCIQSEFGEEF